jgi:hypothetical protein
MADLLAGDDQIDRVGAETAMLGRHHQPGHPGLGERLPDLQARLTIAGRPAARHGRRIGGGQHVVQGGGELLLLAREREIHQPLSSRPALAAVIGAARARARR